jgi:hypothetical protein
MYLALIGGSWFLKALVVSDFHGSIDAVRKASSKAEQIQAEVVVVCGDITDFGSVQNAKKLLLPLVKLRLPVFFVPGNCDPPALAEFDLGNIWCIHGSCRAHDNLVFAGVGGCPVSPFNTPFEMTEDEIMTVLEQSFNQCELKPPQILVSHTPPKDTKLDMAFSGGHVGSLSVRKYIENRKPSLVFCGHIHEAKGIDHIGETIIVNPGPARHDQCAIANIEEKGEIEIRFDSL